MAIDVTIAAGLGRFFAHKIRAAALWAIYDRAGHARGALDAALTEYRAARDAWVQVVEQSRSVYATDVSYGIDWFQRGHWSDRLPAIEADIATMEAQLASAATIPVAASLLSAAIRPSPRVQFRPSHTAPDRFTRGIPLPVQLSVASADAASVQCLYRRTHQAESWSEIAMSRDAGTWEASLPESVTGSSFPIQYYFRIADNSGQIALYPGFNSTLSNQPYFVIRPRRT